MCVWVRLLAWLAACLLFGVAEADPLPAVLVELVRSSPISSIEELQSLLLSDSTDQEEEGSPAASGGHRSPRSLDAQPAQQALCKVRTEVVEVTRAMLDRSNANFLLWPPCVEVQRCSGCCNTKSLQCVPVLTHTRYLQVMKIEYTNKRPTYTKAVVSVDDHVECRCQLAPRQPAPKKKNSRRGPVHITEQHHNQSVDQGKTHSKEVLHRQDEFKQNQGVHLEELLEQHWSPRGDTFSRPEERHGLGREASPHSEETVLYTPHWIHNATKLLGAKDGTIHLRDAEQSKYRESNRTLSPLDVDGGGAEAGVEKTSNSTEKVAQIEWGQQKSVSYSDVNVEKERTPNRGDIQTERLSLQDERFEVLMSQRNNFDQKATPKPHAQRFSSTDTTHHGGGGRLRPTKEPNPEPRGEGVRRGNDTPEERRLLMEEEKVEAERRELLLLHRRLDREKELMRQQQLKKEEEREREKERGRQHHHYHKEHRHLQTTTTTTQKIVTSPATTQTPLTPGMPRPSVRPNQRKRRLKKTRKQISKAAMRAMLM